MQQVVNTLQSASNSANDGRRTVSHDSHQGADNRGETIQLSTFDPREDDVREWITDVERARAMYGWDDYETMHRFPPYLTRKALEWFKEWKVPDRKWLNFVLEIRCSFPKRIDFGYAI